MHIHLCLFVYSIAQEGFDYVYSTVNKKKKPLNQPRQENGKTKLSKPAAVHASAKWSTK